MNGCLNLWAFTLVKHCSFVGKPFNIRVKLDQTLKFWESRYSNKDSHLSYSTQYFFFCKPKVNAIQTIIREMTRPTYVIAYFLNPKHCSIVFQVNREVIRPIINNVHVLFRPQDAHFNASRSGYRARLWSDS